MIITNWKNDNGIRREKGWGGHTGLIHALLAYCFSRINLGRKDVLLYIGTRGTGYTWYVLQWNKKPVYQ